MIALGVFLLVYAYRNAAPQSPALAKAKRRSK
jgi:hypothetical protein